MYQPMTWNTSILVSVGDVLPHHIFHQWTTSILPREDHRYLNSLLTLAYMRSTLERANLWNPTCPASRLGISPLSTCFVYWLHGFPSRAGCHRHSAEWLHESYAHWPWSFLASIWLIFPVVIITAVGYDYSKWCMSVYVFLRVGWNQPRQSLHSRTRYLSHSLP